MYTIGIISDTHLHTPDPDYISMCKEAFANCDAIIHAGDLTDISILRVFEGKEIIAVRGNMCNRNTQFTLPERKVFTIHGYKIGVCHGAGPRHNIEDRVFEMFPDADCIVYGHSHIAACHNYGSTLIINPGSFQATGKYGQPGSYAILKIDKDGLHANLYELSENR